MRGSQAAAGTGTRGVAASSTVQAEGVTRGPDRGSRTEDRCRRESPLAPSLLLSMAEAARVEHKGRVPTGRGPRGPPGIPGPGNTPRRLRTPRDGSQAASLLQASSSPAEWPAGATGAQTPGLQLWGNARAWWSCGATGSAAQATSG